MPQLARETSSRRAPPAFATPRRRGASRWLDGLVGTDLPVLIENHGKGHSDNFAPVAIAGALRGDDGHAAHRPAATATI